MNGSVGQIDQTLWGSGIQQKVQIWAIRKEHADGEFGVLGLGPKDANEITSHCGENKGVP